MIKVFEVNTVERVERRYVVQITKPYAASTYSSEELKAEAEELVRTGEVYRFTEGNSEIEEVVSVREQK